MLALPVARPSAPHSLSHPPILLHTTLFSWSQVRVRAGRFLLMQQTGRSLLILKYLTWLAMNLSCSVRILPRRCYSYECIATFSSIYGSQLSF